ncbi:MAG TPA: DUF2798 domain-containing protein [Armatimonadota bacterium]|jgi:hypothetical protein
MPRTKTQALSYALLSVGITVHIFVWFNIALETGGMSNQVFIASCKYVPIECAFALLLQLFVAGPLSKRIAFGMVNPREDRPFVVSTAIICATICLMCPMMSFVATILYNGITAEFLAQWLQKIAFNFPLAFFSQLFFIQPLVRYLFGAMFRKQIASRTAFDRLQTATE